VHVVSVVQARFVDDVGAVLSYCNDVHVVSAVQTRLDTVVGAVL
jgi:hypothetical protein